MHIMDKLFDPQWMLIGGISIAVIAIIVAKFPQRPK
jgi:ABC-type Co2+ transport system permease subunit